MSKSSDPDLLAVLSASLVGLALMLALLHATHGSVLPYFAGSLGWGK